MTEPDPERDERTRESERRAGPPSAPKVGTAAAVFGQTVDRDSERVTP